MHADQQAGGDPRVALVDAELRARSPRRAPATKCAITSSSLACSAGDSSMIRAKVAKPGLQRRGHSRSWRRRSAPRIDSPGSRSRIASTSAASRFGHLVEEEVLLRREVVEDGLLGDARRGSDLGDGDLVEAALPRTAASPRSASSLPRVQLLGLPQAHVRSVTQYYSCRNNAVPVRFWISDLAGRRSDMLARLAHLDRPPSLAPSSASGSCSPSSAASPPARSRSAGTRASRSRASPPTRRTSAR